VTNSLNINIDKIPVVDWFQESFNLSNQYELSGFVKRQLEFHDRKKEDKSSVNQGDNIWILKNYRGRMSVDYPITSDINCAIRHQQSNPRLAMRYIPTPVLWKVNNYCSILLIYVQL
jgi:hypothetical protein